MKEEQVNRMQQYHNFSIRKSKIGPEIWGYFYENKVLMLVMIEENKSNKQDTKQSDKFF